MALLVVLVSAEQDGVALGPDNLRALARLGVTSVSLARDELTTAIVLEGWALDPESPSAALAALGASTGTTRALQPVVQMAVQPTAESRTHETEAGQASTG